MPEVLKVLHDSVPFFLTGRRLSFALYWFYLRVVTFFVSLNTQFLVFIVSLSSFLMFSSHFLLEILPL